MIKIQIEKVSFDIPDHNNYICFLVDRLSKKWVMGVVRESDTMIHLHELARNCCGNVCVRDEKTQTKSSMKVDRYLSVSTLEEAKAIHDNLVDAKRTVKKLTEDE